MHEVTACWEKNKMETFYLRRLKHCVPGLFCLSLDSTLLDSIFINYLHRTKHIRMLDDQEIWQPNENYMSQEDDCNIFFIIIFLNLHPSPGFSGTELRCHSALILGTFYALQPFKGLLSWS